MTDRSDEAPFTATPSSRVESEQQPDGTVVWVVRVTDPLGVEHTLRSRADWEALKARWTSRQD